MAAAPAQPARRGARRRRQPRPRLRRPRRSRRRWRPLPQPRRASSRRWRDRLGVLEHDRVDGRLRRLGASSSSGRAPARGRRRRGGLLDHHGLRDLLDGDLLDEDLRLRLECVGTDGATADCVLGRGRRVGLGLLGLAERRHLGGELAPGLAQVRSPGVDESPVSEPGSASATASAARGARTGRRALRRSASARASSALSCSIWPSCLLSACQKASLSARASRASRAGAGSKAGLRLRAGICHGAEVLEEGRSRCALAYAPSLAVAGAAAMGSIVPAYACPQSDR